jgi:hypothetical protein
MGVKNKCASNFPGTWQTTWIVQACHYELFYKHGLTYVLINRNMKVTNTQAKKK